MTASHSTLKLATFLSLALSLGMITPAIAESGKTYVDDATLTAKVKEAIFDDSLLTISQVNVQTTKGTVSLSGIVESAVQQAEAVKVAGQVKGVMAVHNNLSIRVVDDD